MKKSNKKWIIGCICMGAFIVFVSALAYFKYIPTQVNSIPYYDSIGHFMLFGLLGFFAEMAFQGLKKKIFGITLPVGSILVASYAFIDESLQVFSPNRTFDLHDLVLGLFGILFFYWVSRCVLKNT